MMSLTLDYNNIPYRKTYLSTGLDGVALCSVSGSRIERWSLVFVLLSPTWSMQAPILLRPDSGSYLHAWVCFRRLGYHGLRVAEITKTRTDDLALALILTFSIFAIQSTASSSPDVLYARDD